MDLDYARRRIQEAPDVPALSEVMLELLELVSALDDLVARQRQRIEILEGQVEPKAMATTVGKALAMNSGGVRTAFKAWK